MPRYKVGQRVKWAYPEPTAEPDELHGKVLSENEDTQTVVVLWDDGTEDENGYADIKGE
jgi:hypothetical protein